MAKSKITPEEQLQLLQKRVDDIGNALHEEMINFSKRISTLAKVFDVGTEDASKTFSKLSSSMIKMLDNINTTSKSATDISKRVINVASNLIKTQGKMPSTKELQEAVSKTLKEIGFSEGEAFNNAIEKILKMVSENESLFTDLQQKTDDLTKEFQGTLSDVLSNLRPTIDKLGMSSESIKELTENIIKASDDFISIHKNIPTASEVEGWISKLIQKSYKLTEQSIIEIQNILKKHEVFAALDSQIQKLTDEFQGSLISVFDNLSPIIKKLGMSSSAVKDLSFNIMKSADEFISIHRELPSASEIGSWMTKSIQQSHKLTEESISEIQSIVKSTVENSREASKSIEKSSKEFFSETNDISSEIFKHGIDMLNNMRYSKEKIDSIVESIKTGLSEYVKIYGKVPTTKDLEKLISKSLKEKGLRSEELIAKVTSAFTKGFSEELNLLSKLKDEIIELSYELIKPFNKLTDWIEKIPGGKILSKMFGFDKIRRDIQTQIQDKLQQAFAQGGAGAIQLKDVALSSFKSMGAGIKALFSHPYLLALALIIGALYVAYKQWNKIIDSAKALRDETGIIGKHAKSLSDESAEIAERFMAMGVGMEDVTKATGALINEFQHMGMATEGMRENAALMVGALGVAPDAAAKTLRIFKNMGNLTDEMSGNLMASVADTAALGGVAPSAVFKDIAESSKEIYLYFKGNVVEATKAAIQLRRMGTSLKEAANTSKSLLDFESSITSELEASVLAGTQLDFSRARYLAFTGKLAASQDEILNQIERIHNFENMNVIQKEAIAKASGMELDQLENMLQQRKDIAKMDYKQRSAYDASLEALSEFRDANKLDLIQQNQRLLAQEQMNKSWENLIFKLSSIVFPLFDAIYGIVEQISHAIQDFFSGNDGKAMLKDLKSSFAEIGKIIAEIIPPLIHVMSVIMPVLIDLVKAFLDPFRIGIKVISDLIKGDFSAVLKNLPKLVESIFKRIFYMMTYPFQMVLAFIDNIFGTNLRGIFTKTVDSVISVFGDIVSAIIKPFKIVYDIFDNLFSGKIKESIQGVFDFIKSIWSKAFHIITLPFSIALSFIDGIFGTGLKEVFNNVIEWISGVMTSLFSVITLPFTSMIALITDGFTGLGDFLTGWWDKIYNAVIQPLVDAWDFLFGSNDTKEVDVTVKDKSKDIVTPTPTAGVKDNSKDVVVPATATGGVVTSPQVRLVGEAGPEAIIPLNNVQEFGNANSYEVMAKFDELINKTGNTDQILKKLDILIAVMKSMDVNMDGKKVGEMIATATPNFGRA